MPAPRWAENGRRTVAGHEFMLAVEAWLCDEPKALRQAIGKLRKNDPAYRAISEDNLVVRYYELTRLPPPLPTDKGRWTAVLMEWGKATRRHPAFISAEQAREIVDRLVAVPSPRCAEFDQLFTHPSIHRSGRAKIKWLQSAIALMERNPNYWPIPISRYGRHDVVAGKIEAYLANAPEQRAHIRDIVAGTGLRETTIHNTLGSLKRAGRIHHFGNGVYGLLTPGVACAPYIPTEKAILDVLGKGGEYTPAELRALTGKSEGAVHAALHRLHNTGRIVRTRRGRYASAGNARPHVYARDAIINA